MPPAIIGGAIAAVGAGASAIAGNSAAGKAAAATDRAAELSAQVQREIYGKNNALLAPQVTSGNMARDAINAFAGLGGDDVNWEAYTQADGAAMDDWRKYWSGAPGSLGNMTLSEYGKFHYNNDGQRRDLSPFTASNIAQQGLDRFRQSTGYQDTVNVAMRGVSALYAGTGAFQSGAAMKGAQDRANRLAMDSRGEYLNILGNQQQAGLSAGSALAGVGSNYANSLGNIYGQQGANQANAALLKGQNWGNALAGLGNMAGTILGGAK